MAKTAGSGLGHRRNRDACCSSDSQAAITRCVAIAPKPWLWYSLPWVPSFIASAEVILFGVTARLTTLPAKTTLSKRQHG
jgi:hypothetical protein